MVRTHNVDVFIVMTIYRGITTIPGSDSPEY